MPPFNPYMHFILRWSHISLGAFWLGCLFLLAFILFDWAKVRPNPPIGSLRQLMFPLLRALMGVATLAYALGFLLMTDLSHVVGRKMFTMSWGLFMLTATYLGTQLIGLTWAGIAAPGRRALARVPDTETLVSHSDWLRAETASHWSVVAAIPFLFFMVAANHWVIILDKAKLVPVFAGFFVLASAPWLAVVFVPKPLRRSALLPVGFAMLATLILTVIWGEA